MSLKAHLLKRISETGPLSLAEYMSEALWHPRLGYYAMRNPLGGQGDFTTAPEISQMFGELIGLALAQSWLDQGAPAPFTLAELGPGRGTLMADALRATTQVPGFLEAAELALLEASPVLREVQHETLGKFNPQWIEAVEDLPAQPLFAVANEFFDALPIRQFQRDGTQWRERRVGARDGALCFGLDPTQPQPALAHRLEDTKDGDIVEDCPGSAPIMHALGTRIAKHGGAALIIDYGDWRSLGDTFQAVQAHTSVDPLAEPGHADLTAHVDFEALARAAAPASYARLATQGAFLGRLGITPRAERLAEKLQGNALETHLSAYRRLTHPEEMGTLFKVFALFPPGAAPPPGCTL